MRSLRPPKSRVCDVALPVSPAWPAASTSRQSTAPIGRPSSFITFPPAANGRNPGQIQRGSGLPRSRPGRPSAGIEHEEETMFAVIKTGGKQYRVAEKDVITIDKVKGAPGDLVEFAEVLVLGGDNIMIGTPTVAGASVAGEVVEQTRGAKVIAFKKRRRKNSRRKRGHRQELPGIRTTEIPPAGGRPTPRPQAAEATPEEDFGDADHRQLLAM